MNRVLNIIAISAIALFLVLPSTGQLMRSSEMGHAMPAAQCLEHCVSAFTPENVPAVAFVAAAAMIVFLLLTIGTRPDWNEAVPGVMEDIAKSLRKRRLDSVVLRN